jgi:Zn-dependent protease
MNFISKSWPLFRAFGVPVKMHISFLGILAVIALTDISLLGLYTAAIGCIVAHEYGHVLAARHFDTKCEVIYLHFFGGAAMLHPPPKPSLTQDWMVALAGPLVSFGLGAGFIGLFALIGIEFLLLLGVLNVFVGLFNLLPIYPMDGGRIYKAVMERLFGKQTGTTIAIMTARVLAIAAAISGIVYGFYFIVAVAAFVILLGYNEQQYMKMHYAPRRY